MDAIKQIMETQLTELELVIYLIITNSTNGEKPVSYRELADWLGTNHSNIARIYNRAKNKIAIYGEVGLFVSTVEK